MLTFGGLAKAEAPPPVEAYGKLPAVESPRLSPDGKSLAFLSSVGGRRCLLIRHLDEERTSGVCPGDYEVRSVAWKSDRRLILEMYTKSHSAGPDLKTSSRLVAIDINGRNPVDLARPRAERAVDFGQDQIIDILSADLNHVLIAVYRSDPDSPDVVRVNIDTGTARTMVTGQSRITTWKSDSTGEIRAGVAVEDGWVKVYYRDDGQSGFRLIHQVPTARASDFAVLAVGDRPGLLYVASTEPTGRRAIYGYDVATDRLLDAYASNPEVDIDAFMIDHGRPVGYGYTIDEPRTILTEPVSAAEAEKVAAALPEFRVTMLDSAADGARTLVLAAGGNRPGIYYLLSRTEDKATLAPIGKTRPNIPDSALAPVTPVSYRARDGLNIHGYVTLPRDAAGKGPIPFVVLPHGGPSTRDVLGFDYLAQMIASRGYGVFQPNYRGSRGYGGAFERAGFQQWGLAMQDDVTDGARWLIDQKLADPGRICIVGWSYGGYAALMGAVKTPDLYRCAASMAGVSDLRRRLDRASQSRFADLNVPRFDSDPAAIEANSPVLHADRIRIPILLAHGRRDFTVPVEDTEAMERALKQAGKPVRAVYFDDDDHYLFREDDRIAFLKALDSFLAENLGPGIGATETMTATN